MEQRTRQFQSHGNGSLTLDYLPFDIKDDIISFVDSTNDLLCLALASKEWTSMVIPNHIEYRELKVRVNHPKIWHHLATRVDLAKNIRIVHILTQITNRKERFPSTLTGCNEEARANSELPATEGLSPDMYKALSNFKSLQKFTWIGEIGNVESSPLPDSVFNILVQCQELQEVRLWQVLVPPHLDQIARESSVWKLSNLRKLFLRGAMWASLEGFEGSFISMLRNSPNLEDLSISFNPTSPVFITCHFPRLIKLHLYAEYTASNPGQNLLAAEPLISDFLIAHPTIENLRWYPIDQALQIPTGLLPRLRCILTNHRTAVSILRDPILIQQRKMELISQISLGPNTMQLLETIDGSRVHELHIWRISIDEGPDQLRRVAALFPRIRTLVIPNFGNPFGHDDYSRSLDECIDCLASFPALENIRESSLWFAIQTLKGQEKLDAPRKLATRCRRLKILNHYNSSTSTHHDIVFKRTGSKITWSERVNHECEV